MARALSPQESSCGLEFSGLSLAVTAPLNLRVAPGECVTVSGPSGVGKTLLLRALADLDPHPGRVALDGADANAMPPAQWRRRVGLLLAESSWWHERVGEHFPPTEGGDLQLQALGFGPEVLDWNITRLSSGERQRLALLRLLALRPRALMLDEPTANLDPENTALVEQLVQDYRVARQVPVLWVSHDSAQRARVADRQLLLDADGLRPLP